MENEIKSREYKFPLAIKVNAWLTIIIPIIIFIMTIIGVMADELFLDMARELTYDPEFPISSVLSDLQIIISGIAVWIVYFQKKHVKYILKVFYIDYAITVLLNMPTIIEEPVFSILFLILSGLPVLWLYMSKDVKEFMRSIENE